MENTYIEDIKEIKEMMNRSSRFISLSGLSGVSAGLSALLGAYWAYQSIYSGQDYLGYRVAILDFETIIELMVIVCTTLVLALGSGFYFTSREAKKKKQKMWDNRTKRLLINLAIPLFFGGVFCLILLSKGYLSILAPLTLIFYGLALVNASKYTLPELRSLGILELVLGLFATYFIGYGLIYWAIGFGLLHIVYGLLMHLKYN
ncbi:MAG: hypothetical protein AAGC47_03290 [Bacteroidota bacterium]